MVQVVGAVLRAPLQVRHRRSLFFKWPGEVGGIVQDYELVVSDACRSASGSPQAAAESRNGFV